MDITTIIILLIIGFLLLSAEIILPGGVAGVIGGLFLLGGTIGAFTVDPVFGLWILLGTLVASGAVLFIMIQCVRHTRAGKHLVLQRDAHDWHAVQEETSTLEGKTGVSHGPLRPTGAAVIEGQRVHVVTEGEMIEAGTPIRVVKVQGNRIVVREEQPDNDDSSA